MCRCNTQIRGKTPEEPKLSDDLKMAQWIKVFEAEQSKQLVTLL